ncbi:hypothetical protein OpiT1DRAFT_00171 [Opitutaceae bacterium TAV1]|nr:hypothetical protein OpiT1DRAFT_00171 [Opitutaceae bacterium TAV1]
MPEAFASALDIRLTKRVKNKDRPKGTPAVYEEILTQGDIYSFQNEDVIYDSPKATEPGVTWGEALWHFTKRMRVTLATSGADGIVHFEIWCPDIAEGTVRKQSEYVTTQAEFVRYLKTGKLPN